MRIGLNVSLASSTATYRQTGVSRYVTELESAVRRTLPPQDSLVSLGAIGNRRAPWPSARIAWEQAVLPREARAQRVDVLHSPVNVVPFLWRGPSVVTVHDLAFLRFPEHLSVRRRAWLTAAIRLSAHRADRVIAVSRSTADDLVSWLGLPAGRVVVVHSAPSPSIRPLDGKELDDFRVQNGIRRPFILTVGTLEPRKNLPTLLRAFARVKDVVPHDLVVIGPEGWLGDELHRAISDLDLGDRLRMTGFVSDADLGGWYSAADLFAVPSFYEGFCLPAVEAMRCGAPVLGSDSSCFSEVLGDAGRLVDPHDLEAWVSALTDVLGDDEVLTELRRRGLARAASFDWARTASETYQVYADVARR